MRNAVIIREEVLRGILRYEVLKRNDIVLFVQFADNVVRINMNREPIDPIAICVSIPDKHGNGVRI